MTPTRSDGSGWFTLGCVALVAAVCAVLLALGGCGDPAADEQRPGRVCQDYDTGCPSHTGGEAGP